MNTSHAMDTSQSTHVQDSISNFLYVESHNSQFDKLSKSLIAIADTGTTQIIELNDYVSSALTAMRGATLSRDVRSRLTDNVGYILNDVPNLELSILNLTNLIKTIKTNAQLVIVEQKRLLEAEIASLNERDTKKFSFDELVNANSVNIVGSTDDIGTRTSKQPQPEHFNWADEPYEEPPAYVAPSSQRDMSGQHATPWTTVGKRKSTQPSHSTNQSGLPKFEFSVKESRDSHGTRWLNMMLPVDNIAIYDNGMTTQLFIVENEKQFKQLPPGMMVYNKGERVPKLMLSTGREHGPATPLNCRMWDTACDDTLNKYSRYNHRIEKDMASSINSDQFYIDKKASVVTKLPEDTYRNFRNTTRYTRSDIAPARVWTGYYVYKMSNFGDGKLLEDQLAKVSLDDTADLYQYSLWMMMVSMIHYQCRNW